MKQAVDISADAATAVRARRPFVLAHPRCPASRCLTGLAVKLKPPRIDAAIDLEGGWRERIWQWLG